MDINQLKYFVCIVDNDYNLSASAKKLHISQPALTQYLHKFEAQENTELFTRYAGRLTGLTIAGENLYANALTVIRYHETLLRELRDDAKVIKGSVRIGIPPLILSVLCTKLLTELLTKNPNIKFEIDELGAFDLRKKLLLHEVDFAVLLQPSDLNPAVFAEEVIHNDELTVFMSEHHPLAHQETLTWLDLKPYRLSIFDESFMIHHQLKRKFDSMNLKPNIGIMSGSWDFLLDSVRDSNFITILPSPIRNLIKMDRIVEKHLVDPIFWHVILAYPIKNHRTRIESYTRKSIVDYYTKGLPIKPIQDELKKGP